MVVGTTQITTTITLKEFALSRRNKPFSRSEARREIKIVPIIASTKKNTLEVVIEKARPGVYTFTVEPANGMETIAFTMKLYDGTAHTNIKELGKQALVRKKVLCKILMPEGIFWDDEDRFSGVVEDSRTITKFNHESGLVWKEEKDK